MDERDLEFPRPGETALPPEFTPLPDEFGQSGGTAPPAKAGRTLWKKVLYALAGLSALTAVTLSGAGTAPETTVLPETPSAQVGLCFTDGADGRYLLGSRTLFQSTHML